MSQFLCFNLDYRDWGHPTQGCEDHSDKTMKSNSPCLGDTYTYQYYGEKTAKVSWKWFHCDKAATPVCIHKNSRCDMHPHPECMYKDNTTGNMVAQDEEGCLDGEYKKKGLIKTSANFKCWSKIHNLESSSILSTVFNWTIYNQMRHDGRSISEAFDGGLMYNDDGSLMYNESVIPNGISVNIWATRCNSDPECWNDIDEADCGGFNLYQSFGFRKFMNRIILKKSNMKR